MQVQDDVGTRRIIAATFLANGSMVTKIDARDHCVLVPEHLRAPDLVLLWGYSDITTPPITGLSLGEFNIEATMVFQGHLFFVRVPWMKIWAIGGTEEGLIFPKSVPEGCDPGAGEPKSGKPKLRLVD